MATYILHLHLKTAVIIFAWKDGRFFWRRKRKTSDVICTGSFAVIAIAQKQKIDNFTKGSSTGFWVIFECASLLGGSISSIWRSFFSRRCTVGDHKWDKKLKLCVIIQHLSMMRIIAKQFPGRESVEVAQGHTSTQTILFLALNQFVFWLNNKSATLN